MTGRAPRGSVGKPTVSPLDFADERYLRVGDFKYFKSSQKYVSNRDHP
jgi:hypothetical protein